MNEEEYYTKKQTIIDQANEKHRNLNLQYALDNRNELVGIGDIIIDHNCSIIVTSIEATTPSLRDLPQCKYKGHIVNDLENSIGIVYQENIKEHILKVK